MEEKPEIKPGFWMSKWYANDSQADFAFESDLHMTFLDEVFARQVSEMLFDNAEIVTEVIRIDPIRGA